MQRPYWPPERLARLRELLAEQEHSAGIIAQMLSSEFKTKISRNAIIGKVHRDGLKLPRSGKPKETLPRGARSHRSPRRLAPRRPPKLALVAPAPPIVPLPVAPVAQRLPEQLQCSWPIGDPDKPDFGFCPNERLPRRPYCAGHCRLAAKVG